MSQQKTKTTTGTKFWSLNLRPKVGITVTHNLREWINTSGANSEPDENSNDWEAITDDLSALKQNTESLFGIREPSNPQIVQSPIPVDIEDETEYLVGKNQNGQDIMMQRVSFSVSEFGDSVYLENIVLKNRNNDDIQNLIPLKIDVSKSNFSNSFVGTIYTQNLSDLFKTSNYNFEESYFQIQNVFQQSIASFRVETAAAVQPGDLEVSFDIYYKDTLF